MNKRQFQIVALFAAIAVILGLGVWAATAHPTARHVVVVHEPVGAVYQSGPVFDHPFRPTQAEATQAVQAELTASITITRWHPIPRWHAYLWAIFHDKGCWYVWGGNGPCWAGFDCSGLVVDAYAHVGIHLPRTTWEMLNDWAQIRPIPLSQARAGDLIFMYGGAHVELYTGHWGRTFGAHTGGTVSGFTDWSNVLGAYHVVGAG